MTEQSKGQSGASTEAADEIVDLEEYAKQGKKPPKAKKYRIRVDKEKFVVDVPSMTGREILTLAGKTPPEQFKLFEIKNGNRVKIGLDQTVDFTEHGVERFTTLPLDQTEGSTVAQEVLLGKTGEAFKPRRHFSLPSTDEAFLNAAGFIWETVTEDKVQRLVIWDYPVCAGYNVSKVKLFLIIEPGYPDAQIDMVYFLPGLARTDGKPIGALVQMAFDGATWQRWSRHRTPTNPWQMGIDCIETHLLLVDDWLQREFKLR